MKILNLIIALQLVLLQIPMGSVGNITYAQTAETSADCPEGMYLDMKLNRCVLKQEVQNTKVKANRCDGKTGEEYRECYEQNVKDEMGGLEETSDVGDGKVLRYGVPVLVTIIAAYYLLRLKFSKKYGSVRKCFTGSMWLMLGGGVAGLITEISAQTAYKKRIKELEEEYKSKMSSNESSGAQAGDEGVDEEEANEAKQSRSSNAQTLALNYMIDQEKARKDAAKRRKNGYMISGMAYTAAAALAIYEQVKTGTWQMGACTEHLVPESTTPSTEGGTNSELPTTDQTSTFYTPLEEQRISIDEFLISPEMNEIFADYSHHDKLTFEEITEIFQRKLAQFNDALIPNAYAQSYVSQTINNFGTTSEFSEDDGKGIVDPDTGNPSSDAADVVTKTMSSPETVTLRKQYGNVIDKAISTPYIRAALAGVLATYSFIMMKKAKDNMKIADDRIKALESILLGFEESGGAGLASYCEEEDRRNPSKPNCYCYNEDGSVNNVRKNRDVCKYYIANKGFSKGEYGALKGLGYNPMKSCLKSDGKIDAGCGLCSRDPERCEIIPALTVGGMAMGSTKVFGKAMKSLNNFNNGGLNSSNLNEANINRQIAAFRKMKDKLSKDPRFKDTNKKANDFSAKLKAANLRALNGSQNAIKAIIGSTNPAPASNAQVNAALSKDIKKKLEKANTQFTAGGSDGSKAAASNNNDNFDFGFGGGGGGGAEGGLEIEGEVSDVMDKKFKFAQNDINKNKNGNIFKILSIRYQRSAMIRLFDEEGEYKVDEASNNDINNGQQ